MSLRRVSFAIGSLLIASEFVAFGAAMPSLALSLRPVNAMKARKLTPGTAFTTAPPGIVCGGDAFFPGGSPLDPNQVTGGGSSDGMSVLTPTCDSPSGGPSLGSYVTWEKVTGADGSCVQVPTTHVYLMTTTSGTNHGTTQFSVEAEGGSGGCSCGSGAGADGAGFGYSGSGAGGGCVGCEGNSANGPLMSLGSVRIRLPLGFLDERQPLGVLRLEEETTGTALGDLSHLQFDQADYFEHTSGSPVTVIRDSGNFRQIVTPEMLVDIVPAASSAAPLLYTVTQYRDWSAGTLYTGASPFREWKVYRISSSKLQIDDFILAETALSQRASYVYEHVSSPAAWTLKTYSGSSALLQTESLTDWTAQADDPAGRAVRKRTYTVKNPSNAEVFKSDEYQTEYQWLDTPFRSAWRRTKLVVDPAGLQRTTEWTYAVGDGSTYAGLVVQSVKRPDGGWTWYQIGPCAVLDSSRVRNPYALYADWMFQEITGIGDAAFPSTCPSPRSAGTRTVTRVYTADDIAAVYRLEMIESHEGTTEVSRTDYTPTFTTTGGSVTAVQKINASGATLSSTLNWTHGPGTGPTRANRRLTKLSTPGRAVLERSESSCDLTFSSGYPSPHTISTGSGAWRVLESMAKTTADAFEVNRSTRDRVVVDAAGRVWYRDMSVCTATGTSGPTWSIMTWTSSLHDDAGRLVDTWSSDGRRTEVNHSSCCQTITTDENGIETTVTRDALGRTTSVLRQGITTEMDYATARQETTTVSASGLTSMVTTRYRDAAGRPIRVDSAVGQAGERRTFVTYGTGAYGGLLVTTYRDYPTGSSSGTSGVRDEIREYFADGRLKSVTGSGVVAMSYAYGVDGTSHWRSTTAQTGPNQSGRERKQTTYTDMLGRTAKVDRAGWGVSSSPTVTTSYTYDDSSTARLVAVTPPDAASTTYTYDDFGQVQWTTLDRTSPAEDRVSGSDWAYEYVSGGWWRTSESLVYLPGATSATTVSTQRTQLSGFSSGVIANSQSIDIAGNVTTTTTTLNRGTSTRTVTTDTPDSVTSAVQTYLGGLLTSSKTATGVMTDYGYDAFQRQHTTTDARGNVTTTYYDASGRVSSVELGTGSTAIIQSTYTYYETGDASAGEYPGRVKSITNAESKATYFAYTNRGEAWRTWGDVPYPTENHYNAYGERDSLKTFRDTGVNFVGSTWPSSPGTADETTWTYDTATGLLNRKTYADSTHVDYTYAAEGHLATRDWARPGSSGTLTTTYGYDSETGELLTVDYEDSTPDVTYTYDRLGRMATVADGAGSRSFHYSPSSLLQDAETFTAGIFAGGSGTSDDMVLTTAYETLSGASAATRFSGIQVGIAGTLNRDYDAAYGYDTLGRMEHVTGPGLPSGSASGAYYSFKLNGSNETGLLDQLQVKNAGTVKVWTGYTYDAQRDLVTAVENNFGTTASYTTLSRYTYLYDDVSRRSEVSYEGTAFSATHVDKWKYDTRNEITESKRYATTQPTTSQPATTQPADLIPDAARRYEYDPIGNRVWSDGGMHAQYTDPNDPNYDIPSAASYTANNLNQYASIQLEAGGRQRLEYDADGNLTQTLIFGDIDGDTDVDLNDLSMLLTNYGLTCASHPGMTDTQYHRADANGDCNLDVTDLSYLISSYGVTANVGNYVGYTWDAENRLTKVTPLVEPIPVGMKRVEFDYDYQGRRIEKRVFNRASGTAWNTNPSERRRFVWYNWLMVMEIIESDTSSPPDGTMDAKRVRRFTWGRDLGGGLESAGGIGGLLAVDDDNGTTTGGSPTADDMRYVYAYDANGNVGQLVDWAASSASASLKAKYEYDVYGNLTAHAGSYEAVNPFRFSTKYWDDETGLGYWGYRYYEPRLGRWMSRDPIGERGGLLLYCYCVNGPCNSFDGRGELSLAHPIVGWIDRFFPCLAAARDRARDDVIWYRNHIGNPGANGYKVWHCLNACHTLRECGGKDPNRLLVWAHLISIGGVGYEIATACGSGKNDSLDGQQWYNWWWDTLGDLLANELGIIVGLGSESCLEGCKRAVYIPGPPDPDNANTPWGPR